MIQKQIITDCNTMSVLPDANDTTVININFGAGVSTALGRRILTFNTTNFKINYFKMLGVRLVTQFFVGVAPPPLTQSIRCDTFLDIEKVLLTDIADNKKSFCCEKNQAIEIPLSYYNCRVFLNDYQDTAFNLVANDYYNELDFDTVLGTTKRKISGISIHHLPNHFYTPDILNYTYEILPVITGYVEMENLSKQQKINLIPDNVR